MLSSYIAERYPAYNHLVEEYARLCQEQGTKIAQYHYGFFTWKAQGDALIVYDLYTVPEYRSKGYAWALFNDIKTLAKALDKCAIIGFSEKEGPNQHLGVQAMKGAKFMMAYDTPEQSIWIRGVN